MAEPDDTIVPLLREMRAENERLHGVTKARLDAIDRTLASFKQAWSADSLMSKLLTGEFGERIEAPERKVRELETHR